MKNIRLNINLESPEIFEVMETFETREFTALGIIKFNRKSKDFIKELATPSRTEKFSRIDDLILEHKRKSIYFYRNARNFTDISEVVQLAAPNVKKLFVESISSGFRLMPIPTENVRVQSVKRLRCDSLTELRVSLSCGLAIFLRSIECRNLKVLSTGQEGGQALWRGHIDTEKTKQLFELLSTFMKLELN
jgi:hypothetical protein